jgi:molecular chaperone DnaJ
MSPFTDRNTHYHTLGINHQAAQSDIKYAYRKLVKQFHPDCNHDLSSHDRIAAINVAYEVLSNPQNRASYDRSIGIARPKPVSATTEQSGQSGRSRRSARQTGLDEEQKLDLWIEQVYTPISDLISDIIDVIDEQIDDLAADPYDDELMGNFQAYIDECRGSFAKAQILFRGTPNPISVASVATHLYHCLSILGDGIEELNYFTLNYDDRHLHTGQEMWRIAEEMRSYAQAAMQNLNK